MSAIETSKTLHSLPVYADRPNLPDWLNEKRKIAYDLFTQVGFPHQSDENWKYIDMAPVLSAEFETGVSREFYPDTDGQGVMVDGVIARLTDPSIKGVTLNRLEAFLASPLAGTLHSAYHVSQDPLALLNTFLADDAIVLHVCRDVKITDPISLTFFETGSVLSLPRLIVIVEPGAQVGVDIRQQASDGQRFLTNMVIEAFVAQDAELNLVHSTLKGEGFRFLYLGLFQEAKSRFSGFFYSQDGLLTRRNVEVRFQGEEALCELNGLSILDGKSEVYNQTAIHHRVPTCDSHQLYKNILSGASKSEYCGLVQVYPDAQKSNSTQMNRNMILSDHAKVFSRPQLKIDADDVKCAHGATVGQLEEDEVFYLCSRGLSREVAKSLLTYGFAEEIVDKIPFKSAQAFVEQGVRDVLRRLAVAVIA